MNSIGLSREDTIVQSVWPGPVKFWEVRCGRNIKTNSLFAGKLDVQ